MSLLRLNIGSGQRPFSKPWTNIDLQSRWNPDVVADVNQLPFPDSSVEIVVSHHCREHLGCGEGAQADAEAWRVLTMGGSYLVFVPDMRSLCQRWLMGKLDTQIFMTNVYGAYMGDEADRHKWGYTLDSLVDELKKQPWSEVKVFDWRSIEGADIARDWWVLAVECVK